MKASEAGAIEETCVWGSRRLWSLAEMMDFSLSSFARGMEILRQEHALCGKRIFSMQPDSPILAQDLERIEGSMNFVVSQCRKLFLMRAESRLERLFTSIKTQNSYAALAKELSALIEAVDDDIKLERFYHYPREKGNLILRIESDWSHSLRAFPSTRDEVFDGVDAYALGKNTACVFHMMRVAEYGLRSLAAERSVVFPNKPVEWATWQELLSKIEASVTAKWGSAAAGPAKDSALSFYRNATAHFHAFKDAYRNQVMHVRSRYDEYAAFAVVNQVRSFMNGLSAKLSEVPLSGDLTWP